MNDIAGAAATTVEDGSSDPARNVAALSDTARDPSGLLDALASIDCKRIGRGGS